MNPENIIVLARVELLATADGGRTTPARGSYRPNHNFFGPDNRNMTIGFIDLPDGRELHPGESVDIPIWLWTWPGIEKEIYPGRRWRIQEGPRLVGMGTVLEVLGTI